MWHTLPAIDCQGRTGGREWIPVEPRSSSIRAVRPSASLRENIELSLSAAIVSGELAPGSLVSVPTLARQFEVSATPVREAMLNLEKLGFVKPVRNKGFRVTEVSRDDLRELVQIRRWLEAPAMVEAASVMDAESAERFRDLAFSISSAAERSDFYEYLSADADFHLALLELTGNRRLVDLVGELRRQTRLVGLVALRDTVELQRSAHEHHELIDLLVQGRGAEAQKLMHEHIGHVMGWWAGVPEATAAVPPARASEPELAASQR